MEARTQPFFSGLFKKGIKKTMKRNSRLKTDQRQIKLSTPIENTVLLQASINKANWLLK